MIKLNNKYNNKNAVIIFGGPSILENNYDLSLISTKDNIIFLQSNALTPRFLEYGIEPDYYFMPYPEKIRTNSLQWLFLQAISCGFELKKHLKKEYINEWIKFKDRFGDYADIWRIEYPHKRYRIKRNVVLDNSPLSLVDKFPNMGLITYDMAYDADRISEINLPNEVFKYTHSDEVGDDVEAYFDPLMRNGMLTIANMGFVNSAAISLYPILKYMGFNKVTLVGMDMSMLGSMEFSASYTFRSMKHYRAFFNTCRRGFSYTFPLGLFKGFLDFGRANFNDLRSLNLKSFFSSNKYSKLYNNVFGLSGKFMRETKQISDAQEIFISSGIEFTNVYEPFEFSKPIPGIKNISFEDFLANNSPNPN
jgi:hypothetical protein